ncbi:biosynthetic-type acetolactate synthase large subunit [Phascolarctobacterium sp. Marseille-Q4147]|uniref:biosynthetic-type acetolactate synthase large subunit n=1 Tax=Phascolarctobacterium sp. Marseille-Q4147 TaxID=2823317 RepID=UPI001B33690E|nr:biosynthetic-type acetolactate synthase large subunit [Phascolarctobacterium sp. Marseille-Q4147]QTV77079.1 biosynthetic-type acetolactate synthase large subunit [Phascolarctobacterium sp. Marseille-Q4147]
MQLTGAEVMVKCLEEEGVSTIFGYPGGAILPFYNALRDVKNIKHVLTAHEQGAAHAADGYARASGKVGVCCATSGPGATNLVTGLANAFLDSIPVVAITGQVKSSMIGHDAFQEVDITGITMPITKQNFLVNKPEELAQTMRLAFQMAKSGRPGPVLVDVAHDVQTSMMEYHASKLRELPVAMPQKDLVAAAVAALNKAERPVMLVGGGVAISGAEYEAVHLCEKMHLPVASTLMGLGCISSYREQFLGMSGLHGHERANNAVANADVVLAVGTRFNDRVTGDRDKYSAHKTIIHIDIDPAELNKNIASTIDISGDMRTILKMLDKGCKGHDIKAWWDTIMTWPGMDEDYGNNAAPLFIEALNPVLKGKDYLLATDVGQHQMFTAQHLKVEYARQLITSGGLGTMGFGLPAAMGAKLARPETKVICISGDGGYKMTGSELFTLASNNIPVVSVVFNNSGLGMIRQLQTVQFNKRFMACECPGYVDFVKYAEAFGLEGEHVATPEDFAAAVKRGLDKDHTYVIEVDIDPKDMVVPMVAPGKGVDEFVRGLGE